MHDATEPFRCEVIPGRERVRLAPVGELDVDVVDRVDEAVREVLSAGFAHVVLDLGRVSFMDSSGLKLLLTLDAESRADGFSLELLPGPPPVQRLFELTGTTDRLPFRR